MIFLFRIGYGTAGKESASYKSGKTAGILKIGKINPSFQLAFCNTEPFKNCVYNAFVLNMDLIFSACSLL